MSGPPLPGMLDTAAMAHLFEDDGGEEETMEEEEDSAGSILVARQQPAPSIAPLPQHTLVPSLPPHPSVLVPSVSAPPLPAPPANPVFATSATHSNVPMPSPSPSVTPHHVPHNNTPASTSSSNPAGSSSSTSSAPSSSPAQAIHSFLTNNVPGYLDLTPPQQMYVHKYVQSQNTQVHAKMQSDATLLLQRHKEQQNAWSANAQKQLQAAGTPLPPATRATIEASGATLKATHEKEVAAHAKNQAAYKAQYQLALRSRLTTLVAEIRAGKFAPPAQTAATPATIPTTAHAPTVAPSISSAPHAPTLNPAVPVAPTNGVTAHPAVVRTLPSVPATPSTLQAGIIPTPTHANPTTQFAPSTSSSALPSGPIPIPANRPTQGMTITQPPPLIYTPSNAVIQPPSAAPMPSSLSSSTSITVSMASAVSAPAHSLSAGSETEWSLTEKAKYQRALVKIGTDFSLLSHAIGSKRNGVVKKFYFDQGGAKGPLNRVLLDAHHSLKKTEGGIESFQLELTEEEKALVARGVLPELFPSAPRDPSSSEDPADAINDVGPADTPQRKKRRAEMILFANARGIFSIDNEDTDLRGIANMMNKRITAAPSGTKKTKRGALVPR
eukprot:TRINITY_DN5299_c0_g1_i4.p1 TRINITY_DN5299_c0_g1~~TRINITY_DN5299_c0_g1_i4.p1  ORF type:complete len:611 (+),score=198.98 TRINITY_DN5299_c0_g1_i4:66-1898(+)